MKKIFSILLLTIVFIVFPNGIHAEVTTIKYRGNEISMRDLESRVYKWINLAADDWDMNGDESRALTDCMVNVIIPKLKNGEIDVKDDNTIRYSGYITYFDHKWDDRKERKKRQKELGIKYNPHEIGGLAVTLLFRCLNSLCVFY